MDHFKGRENVLKGIAPVLSLLAVGLTGGSYYSQFSADEFAFAMTILALIYCVALVVLIVLKKMPATDLSHQIEAIVSLAFVILLAVSAIMYAVKTSKYSTGLSNAKITTRVFALIFQFATAGTFAWILYEIYKKIKR